MDGRRRPTSALTVAVLLALVGATACGTGPGEELRDGATPSQPTAQPTQSQEATHPTMSGHVAGPEGERLPFTDLEVREPGSAEQPSVEILKTLNYTWAEDPTVTVSAVAPDGRALVSSMNQSDFDQSTFTLQATSPVSLWADDGLESLGSTEELIPGDPHRQVLDAQFVNDSVVWQETSSTDLFVSDWRMFRHDLDGGAPQLVARSEQVFPAGSLPMAVGRPVLAAVGNRVGWHTTYEREDGTLRTKVVSVPAAGGELRTESEIAAMPAGAADGWVTLRMIDETVEGAEGGWEIQAPRRASGIDLIEPGGDVVPLITFPGGTDDNWAVAKIAADEHAYAWVAPGEVYVATIGSDTRHRLHHSPDVTVDPHSLSVCGQRVLWVTVSGESIAAIYVFDLESGQISTLPANNPVASVACGGDYVSWTDIETTAGSEVRTVKLGRFT